MYVFILTWIDLRERDPYSEDGLDEIRLDYRLFFTLKKDLMLFVYLNYYV